MNKISNNNLDAETISFSSVENMVKTLQQDTDLYNIETEEYVFHYNIDGAIAVYSISSGEAMELKAKADISGEYWGAYLGVGGTIYDDPAEYCKDNYSLAGWVDVTPR